MGAILLSLVVSCIWLRTALAEFLLLVCVVASGETQQLITYVCVTHSPAVRQIDTVRVYHSGPRLIAEVDVVMDPEASLMETHDIAEALQIKLESLPDVERAYVHVDYETTHKPEHAYLLVLLGLFCSSVCFFLSKRKARKLAATELAGPGFYRHIWRFLFSFFFVFIFVGYILFELSVRD